MAWRSSGSRVSAVLGPTNTGKTHLALERMAGYATAMIGFPLRLLARENYDRLVKVKGAARVALLTGEEKIVPAHPTHFVCTVESMPLDRPVDFLAVDEIQLCADPDRGHVFTERLLHARGMVETMFLGAETIRPMMRRLVPEAEFVTRPRFSTLSYTGPRKLARLPPRSAVVAFSAAEVYALAEAVRRQRGGAAVVLGALSPRTRNAQVELYQSGDVDYLIATDAIGMGLNMDVDHVAFAASRKFDGRVPRELAASEVAQIAGRAGRHMNDGTFGTTADIQGLAPEIVEAVETHQFPPLKLLQWRNSELRFTSVSALQASLERQPDIAGLVRARDADDQMVLAALAKDAETVRLADHPDRVRLLWDVCQIPDFGKVMADQHARLLKAVFGHLARGRGRLPADWLELHLRRIARTDGDIETLIGRIANIRTWTYVSHRADWVEDAPAWRDRTRAIEDMLSDALHDRLTQRFVDRRTAHLVRRLKDGEAMIPAVAKDGRVLLDGHFVGRLAGFRFNPDQTGGAQARRAVQAAAARALAAEIERRLGRLAGDGPEAFALGADGVVSWQGEAVARLSAGPEPARPGIEILPSDLLGAAGRERLKAALAGWLPAHLDHCLRPLFAATEAPLSGAARGLAWQLCQGLGSLPAAGIGAQLSALDAADRRLLARLDIRIGVESVYMPPMLKPEIQALRGLLWAVHQGHEPPAFPPRGRVSLPLGDGLPAGLAEAMGYRPLGGRAIRVDMLERFAAQLRHLSREGLFVPPPALLGMLGMPKDDIGAILEALGYRRQAGGDGWKRGRPPAARPKRGHHRPGAGDNSPFAILARRA